MNRTIFHLQTCASYARWANSCESFLIPINHPYSLPILVRHRIPADSYPQTPPRTTCSPAKCSTTANACSTAYWGWVVVASCMHMSAIVFCVSMCMCCVSFRGVGGCGPHSAIFVLSSTPRVSCSGAETSSNRQLPTSLPFVLAQSS